MLAIDFKKAFDSLNRSFIFEMLLTFNFGPPFMCWIRTFYQNITSSVKNNGFSSSPFSIRRVVTQREPLSAYLFVSLEILAISVCRNNIQGIQVDKEEIELEMFADDVTAFVRNRRSLETLLCTTDLFSECSRLEINFEKTECMLLGNQVSLAAMDVISSKNIRIKDMVKILGVYFNLQRKSKRKFKF